MSATMNYRACALVDQTKQVVADCHAILNNPVQWDRAKLDQVLADVRAEIADTERMLQPTRPTRPIRRIA